MSPYFLYSTVGVVRRLLFSSSSLRQKIYYSLVGIRDFVFALAAFVYSPDVS